MPNQALTDENKRKLLEIVTKMLQKDEPARVVMIRPPIRVTKPGDTYESYDGGKTLYVLIAVGDESPDENIIREILENRIRQEGL